MWKLNLHQLILTKNECYKSGRTITPKGIMVHSTGANNPTLKRYVGPDDGQLGTNKNGNHWNQARPGGRQICMHAFIGKLANGEVATYQTLPWTMRAWHGAKGSKGSVNDTHIGFEICEDDLSDSVYFRKAFDETVAFCAYLCRMFKLDPLKDGVIIGHYEGYQRGIASNHGDPKHWFSKHGESMDTLRAAVKKTLAADAKKAGSEEPAPQPASTSKATTTTAQQAFIDRVGKAAQAGRNDILPSLTIAQAILESGWGKSSLAQKANALFGIKAGATWTGSRVDAKTCEYIDEGLVDTTAAFRAYDSWEESVIDHREHLLGLERYKSVVGERDCKAACRAVHAAGYATDPEYANKLIRLIEQYGLKTWDAEAVSCEIMHVVKQGDTLWSLAKKYLGSGHRWLEIQGLNGGPEKCDPQRLRIGTKLKIPAGGQT